MKAGDDNNSVFLDLEEYAIRKTRTFLALRYWCLEPTAGRGKMSRWPATRLRDANDVQDQKHRHGEGRNVAHGQNGHGCGGDSVRIDDPGKGAQC